MHLIRNFDSNDEIKKRAKEIVEMSHHGDVSLKLGVLRRRLKGIEKFIKEQTVRLETKKLSKVVREQVEKALKNDKMDVLAYRIAISTLEDVLKSSAKI